MVAVVVAVVVAPAKRKNYADEEELADIHTRIDISHGYVVGLPTYNTPRGLQPYFHLVLTFTPRTGTCVDGLGPFNQTLWDQGYDIHSAHLRTLKGPCLVVDTPRGKNITAEVMKELGIPRGVERVVFKTLNTDRKLMSQQEFDSSYTAFTTDGAQYLVSNTNIKLVGIDYLSVGVGEREELMGVHLTFLKAKGVIPVERLKLEEVEAPGSTSLHACPRGLAMWRGPLAGVSWPTCRRKGDPTPFFLFVIILLPAFHKTVPVLTFGENKE